MVAATLNKQPSLKKPLEGQGKCRGTRTAWNRHCQVGVALLTVMSACGRPKAVDLSQHRGS